MIRRYATTLTVIVALLGTPVPTAVPKAHARAVTAWLPYWEPTAYADALAHAGQLRTVNPFWYETTAADRVTAHEGAGDRAVIDGLHRAGIEVVPTVTETLGAAAMAGLTGDARARATHVETLVRLATGLPYDGLDLDYEQMNEPGADPALVRRVRDGFTTLVGEVCARLHGLRKQCTAAVFPRSDTPGHDQGPVFDYARLGRVLDRLRIMGYNLHNALDAPGPLSSPAWYDEILRYATARVPAARIEMGIPAYGWDHRTGDPGRATHRTTREAEELRRRVGAPYALDPASATPHFTYAEDGGARREVWYQDARGIAAHLPVLRRYGVEGTALWALGFEDAELWPVLGGAAPGRAP
ncbi:glycosyl hydrolase family 18 protein [Streptomyces sp. UNOC14_S4]|uniref:glycosyl hydrolase family 18 protein n=1 Tax=Streptomyces sp. UNOC14_S4 TaxID=2872340 RepID=UPI001E548020|nr:glycosyl hydrolase family 18 protein [Streptomyces sp. UNOC14_S4]MCC3770243.1 glycosyl hydrolase [Streptomyces sp. UNOC14_S4]